MSRSRTIVFLTIMHQSKNAYKAKWVFGCSTWSDQWGKTITTLNFRTLQPMKQLCQNRERKPQKKPLGEDFTPWDGLNVGKMSLIQSAIIWPVTSSSSTEED